VSLQKFNAKFKVPENDVLSLCFAFLGDIIQVHECVFKHPDIGACSLPEMTPKVLLQ
jgi:hypothetical protein